MNVRGGFLDLQPHFWIYISISDGFVKTKIYDKRDDFDTVSFPVLDGPSFDILWCFYF